MVSKKKKKYQDITATATKVLRNRSVSLGTADAASKNGEVSSSDSDGDRSSQIMDDVVRSNMMVDEVDQPNKNEGDVPVEQLGKDNRDSEGMVLKTYSSRKRKGKVNQLIDVGDGPSKEKKSAQFVPYAGDSSIPANEKILPEVIKKRKGNRKKGGYGKNSAVTDHSIDDIVVSNDDIIAKSIGEIIVVAKPTVSASLVVFFKSSKDGSYNEVDVNLVAAAENAVKLFKNDGFRESIVVPDDFSQFTLGGNVTLMNTQDNNSGDKDNVVSGIKSTTMEGVETSEGQGNINTKTPRAWVNPNITFADFLKQNKDEEELKMEFIPPALMSNGQKRVVFSAEEVKKGGSAFSLQLYGYFIGTSMDYRVVNAHLRRMWWRYDLKEIVKTAA
ncbi:uncharacterized protein [Rutidosis leptorrhynchoides]|uniref:uncharacterized protein n=1 Tax=Rutidosis leptorrhynchoides TaxID=125765 RepID=UPI003A994535